MDSLSFTLVNAPVSLVSAFTNFFFVFCMCFPQQGTESLKQPLNVLLGTLAGCNIILQFCIFLYIVIDFFSLKIFVYAIAADILYFTMRTSVTSSFWLNVFYYCQIVPAKHPVLIYFKRNLRFFIYSSMIAEKIFFLFGFSENIAYISLMEQLSKNHFTTTQNKTETEVETVNYFVKADKGLQCGYFLFCLFVMLTSNCATIRYLRKHMKSMKGNSSSSSSTRLQRQLRVTITGFTQTLIFFHCLMFLIGRELYELITKCAFDQYGHICCTVITFYSFGTTINLFVGQTIFRERGFEIWQKCLQTVTLSSK